MENSTLARSKATDFCKGRLIDAKESLCWLRGWTKPSGVRSEYRSLVEHFERSSLLQDRPIHHSSPELAPPYTVVSKKERVKDFVRPYLQRSFYLPFGSMTLIYVLYYLSGSTTVQTYSMVIFSKMDSPMDDSIATAWMGAMRVVGAFVVLFSISTAGKRRLLFGSLGLAFICFLLIGCAELLPANDLNPWLPPLAMILAVFGNASGVDSVVHMLNSEIYPASMRYIGSAIGSSVSSVLGSLMNKFFLYIVDAITLPGVFLLFATMNLVAIAVYNGIVPETEGRSLQEIQDHYGGVKSLNGSRTATADQGVDSSSGKTRVTQV
ncbi:hypothetical protein QAD02_018741 [Eretmocerus hayati]|uniref:Uncharacterized protein n=1 Tax=Eretmocerus hayati TaxID=131215 RepID=A0ACC2PHZ1_9HYME|nr:hypothetical protein QAD02_018741 [Eretmocerus hayati]